MIEDLPIRTLIEYVQGDFACAWDALASTPGDINRGNFMFGLQSMILLEVACRLCVSDSTGAALEELSKQLELRDRKYFTALPGSCWIPKNNADFMLPSRSHNKDDQLLAALFDLIRNGQAHQYQQTRVQLKDGVDFVIQLTGPASGLFLGRIFESGRPTDHLKRFKLASGDIQLRVRPEVLFLDIRESIVAARLFDRCHGLVYQKRPKSCNSPNYQFTGRDLDIALAAGGH